MNFWIFDENLQPLVELLAFLAGYTLYDEDYDWVAIKYGIKDTDEGEDKWYTCVFEGRRPLTLHLALNPGSSVVSVRVTSDAAITAELAAQFDLLVAVCQSYTIAVKGTPPVGSLHRERQPG